MLRHINKGHTVEVPLKGQYRGYSAYCEYRYDKKEEKYLLSMRLKREDIDELFKFNDACIDTQYISGTPDTIQFNICKIVEQMCDEKIFDQYIDQYRYNVRCANIGNMILEDEKLHEQFREYTDM